MWPSSALRAEGREGNVEYDDDGGGGASPGGAPGSVAAGSATPRARRLAVAFGLSSMPLLLQALEDEIGVGSSGLAGLPLSTQAPGVLRRSEAAEATFGGLQDRLWKDPSGCR